MWNCLAVLFRRKMYLYWCRFICVCVCVQCASSIQLCVRNMRHPSIVLWLYERVRPYNILHELRKWNQMEQVCSFFSLFSLDFSPHKWQVTANAKWLINSSAWLLIVKFWPAISVSFRICIARSQNKQTNTLNEEMNEKFIASRNFVETCLSTTAVYFDRRRDERFT